MHNKKLPRSINDQGSFLVWKSGFKNQDIYFSVAVVAGKLYGAAETAPVTSVRATRAARILLMIFSFFDRVF